jgi:hypothetical protein
MITLTNRVDIRQIMGWSPTKVSNEYPADICGPHVSETLIHCQQKWGCLQSPKIQLSIYTTFCYISSMHEMLCWKLVLKGIVHVPWDWHILSTMWFKYCWFDISMYCPYSYFDIAEILLLIANIVMLMFIVGKHMDIHGCPNIRHVWIWSDIHVHRYLCGRAGHSFILYFSRTYCNCTKPWPSV